MAFELFTLNDFNSFSSAEGSSEGKRAAKGKLGVLLGEVHRRFREIRKTLPDITRAKKPDDYRYALSNHRDDYPYHPHISVGIGAEGLNVFVALEQVDRLKDLSSSLLDNPDKLNELLAVLHRLEKPCRLEVNKEYFYRPGVEKYFQVMKIHISEQTKHLLSAAELRDFAVTMKRILGADREGAKTIKAPIYLTIDNWPVSFPITEDSVFATDIIGELGDGISSLLPFYRFLSSLT